MQFLNDDSFIKGKSLSQTYLALREKWIAPPVKSWKNCD